MKIALLVIISIFMQSAAGITGYKDLLIESLLSGYHTDIEPDNAELKFGVSFLCARWDSIHKIIHTTAWERYQWKDNRLAWNPSDYGGVDSLRVWANNIWRPNFKLYNSLSHEDKRQLTKCMIRHDGTVIWTPGVEYKTACKRGNVGYDCEYKLGSWSEGSNTVPFDLWNVPFLYQYLNTTCLLLANVKSADIVQRQYPCCSEPYGTLDLTIQYSKNREVFSGFAGSGLWSLD